ncbi:MAG: hypothetical protein IJ374_08755 [Lachnospiraceae bacterium]|nr:hypothetical protein [Lachnospiraceae bacterium]
MNKKQGFSLPVVGGSSLLVIFAVLCLTVFALLSLSTVLADQRLGSASVEAVSSYYEADTRAEEIFARLRNGEMPEGVVKEADVYRYACPISDTQTLHVELKCDGDSWMVLRWQAVAETTMEDSELSVWGG